MATWNVGTNNIKSIDLLEETFGKSLREGINLGKIKYWWAETLPGHGCGGACDYYMFKYTIELSNRSKLNNIHAEFIHNDSCGGERPIYDEQSNKYIHPELWGVEQQYMKGKFGLELPDLPINNQIDNPLF